MGGSTINTPSMVCVEDYLDALAWAESVGGVQGLIARSQANLTAVAEAVEEHPWLDFLAKDPATRSSTSVCLTLDMPSDKLKAISPGWRTRKSPSTSAPIATHPT